MALVLHNKYKEIKCKPNNRSIIFQNTNILVYMLYIVASYSGHSVTLLDTQYRMHPSISFFPNKQFYGGRIQDGIQAGDRLAVQGFPWPTKSAVCFVQVSGDEYKKSSQETSWRNAAEVDVVKQIVLMCQRSVDSNELAVITPYNGQKYDLQKALGQDNIVWTIDESQGKEFDLVVLSTVRCNSKSSIGFMTEFRRVNVALTRAKRGLIIVGDQHTLQNSGRGGPWPNLMEHMIHTQVMISAKDIMRTTLSTSYKDTEITGHDDVVEKVCITKNISNKADTRPESVVQKFAVA